MAHSKREDTRFENYFWEYWDYESFHWIFIRWIEYRHRIQRIKSPNLKIETEGKECGRRKGNNFSKLKILHVRTHMKITNSWISCFLRSQGNSIIKEKELGTNEISDLKDRTQ
jgi:hypothetical protein